MSNKINNYLKLENQIEQISHLGNISSLVHWDSATMLKSGSARTRQQEMATLESLVHEMSISQKIGDLIEAASFENEFLDDWQKTNLKLIKKSYEEEKKEYLISTEIVKDGAPSVKVDYKIRENEDGKYQIYDVIAEGVSIITTQRSEFASILSRGGLSDLIVKLQERNKKTK